MPVSSAVRSAHRRRPMRPTQQVGHRVPVGVLRHQGGASEAGAQGRGRKEGVTGRGPLGKPLPRRSTPPPARLARRRPRPPNAPSSPAPPLPSASIRVTTLVKRYGKRDRPTRGRQHRRRRHGKPAQPRRPLVTHAAPAHSRTSDTRGAPWEGRGVASRAAPRPAAVAEDRVKAGTPQRGTTPSERATRPPRPCGRHGGRHGRQQQAPPRRPSAAPPVATAAAIHRHRRGDAASGPSEDGAVHSRLGKSMSKSCAAHTAARRDAWTETHPLAAGVGRDDASNARHRRRRGVAGPAAGGARRGPPRVPASHRFAGAHG